MTEAELERKVARLCADLGIIRFHCKNPTAMSMPGFPDDMLIGPAGLILFRELKTEVGQPSPEQLLTGELLRRGGHDWAIWRPSDLRGGIIDLEVEAIARGR